MTQTLINALKHPSLAFAWAAIVACAFVRFMPPIEWGRAPSIPLSSVRAQITDGDFVTPAEDTVFDRRIGLNRIDRAPLSLRAQSLTSGGPASQEFLMSLPLRILASQDRISRSKPFGWPALGAPTSGFGQRISPFLGEARFHSGIDIANEEGTAVRATADGIVQAAEWRNGYGSVVLIEHGSGFQTVYGHNSYLAVQPGQKVARGQTIAYMGNSGLSTGAHTHYEVWKNGRCVDPMPYLYPKPAAIRSTLAIRPAVAPPIPIVSQRAAPPDAFDPFFSKNLTGFSASFSGFDPGRATDSD